MVRKNEVQTLILCTDRDFKNRSVTFMNNIAFNAEKVTAESIDDAGLKLSANPKLLNLVIDGTILSDVNHDFDQVKKLCLKSGLMVLLYLTEDQDKEFIFNKHGIKNLKIATLPFDKQVFNDTFHNRGSAKAGPGGASQAFPGAKQVTSTAAQKAKTQAVKNLSAFEASNHVKETIAMINAVDKNRAAMDQLKVIGQRFNGIVGTFGYFANKPGCGELKELANNIDMVVRTYDRDPSLTEIKGPHFDSLIKMAKLSFMILQCLRDDKAVSDDLLDQCKKTFEDFNALSDIDRKESVSQDDIDQMILDKLG